MRTWRRAAYAELCNGPCGRRIERGEPVLDLHVVGLKRVPRRCQHCAGESVPTELPPLVERVPIVPQALTRFTPNMLPIDFKTAAAGREPGEEG